MAKHHIAQKLETYLLVTVVAALVWLFAEGETLTDVRQVTLRLRFTPAAGQDVVIDPVVFNDVTLFYQVPANRVRDVERLADRPVEIDVAPDPDEPRQQINLRDRLANLEKINDIGISVLDVKPAQATVLVEKAIELEADIVADPGTLELTEPADIVPAKATVRMRESYKELLNGKPMVLTARLADVPDLAAAERGQRLTLDVPLTPPQNIPAQHVTITPAKATVTLSIRKQVATTKVQSVPILVRLPIIESNRYEIVPRDNQRFLVEDVELSGPSEVIEQITKGDLPITAELRLTTADLETGVTSKVVHINAPPGVAISSALPKIEFTISKRAVEPTP